MHCVWNNKNKNILDNIKCIVYGTIKIKTALSPTGTGQRKVSKVAGQTLDCYCVCFELLIASIADGLQFVNMVCLPLIAERNAHEICLTQECLQC